MHLSPSAQAMRASPPHYARANLDGGGPSVALVFGAASLALRALDALPGPEVGRWECLATGLKPIKEIVSGLRRVRR